MSHSHPSRRRFLALSPPGPTGPWSYALATDYEHPGHWYVCYCRSAESLRVCRELVQITPAGFMFRYSLFRDLEAMVTYFKQKVSSGEQPPSGQARQVRRGAWGGARGAIGVF